MPYLKVANQAEMRGMNRMNSKYATGCTGGGNGQDGGNASQMNIHNQSDEANETANARLTYSKYFEQQSKYLQDKEKKLDKLLRPYHMHQKGGFAKKHFAVKNPTRNQK